MLITLTGVLFSYSTYLYIQNESTSLVDFATIGKRSDVDIYPSISICPYQLGFIKQSKLKENNITNNAKNYKAFLFGKEWDSKMANIDYDSYTVNLQDYGTSIRVDYRGATKEILYSWTRDNTRVQGTDHGKEERVALARGEGFQRLRGTWDLGRLGWKAR